jgi:hypothetical protein
MPVCDLCGKHPGTHRTKYKSGLRRTKRKYTSVCDGCWKVTKLLGKPILFAKGASKRRIITGEQMPRDKVR